MSKSMVCWGGRTNHFSRIVTEDSVGVTVTEDLDSETEAVVNQKFDAPRSVRLSPRPGFKVAELGCLRGYFSVPPTHSVELNVSPSGK